RPDHGRLRALLGRRDALDALAAAILLGVLSAVDRWAAVVLEPPSYLACSHGAAAVLTGVISAVTVRRGLVELATARNVATIVAHGVLGVTGTAMQTNALTMAPASYVNAIRRLSAVVAVGLGRTLFGEPDLGRRLAAAVMASAGAACLLLAR
ncbi:MAG: hypothetical protein DMD89_29385, partial [Candidatus Rokuibacteriota bacterium]